MGLIKRILSAVLIVTDIVSSIFSVGLTYWLVIGDTMRLSLNNVPVVFYCMLIIFYNSSAWLVEGLLRKKGIISESIYNKIRIFKIIKGVLLMIAAAILLIRRLGV